MTRIVPIAFGLCTLAFASQARAHGFKPALLEIREAAPGRYDVLWKQSREAGESALPAMTPLFPDSCRKEAHTHAEIEDSNFFQLDCGRSMAGSIVKIQGLAESKVDVLWRYTAAERTGSGLLRSGHTQFVVPGAQPGTFLGSLQQYFALGVEHILSGADHLLFVLTLLLVVAGWRNLVTTISAFTVAHSVTLAFSVLGLVQAPEALMEALIPLSIAAVAAQAVKTSRATSAPASVLKPWAPAFGFGLIHGFGFAGALSEMGIAQDAILPALAGFNLGVEAGQLAFVAGLLVVFGLARGLGAGARHRIAFAYAIGGLAVAWMLQRISQF